jgi:hypothetical protein
VALGDGFFPAFFFVLVFLVFFIIRLASKLFHVVLNAMQFQGPIDPTLSGLIFPGPCNKIDDLHAIIRFRVFRGRPFGQNGELRCYAMLIPPMLFVLQGHYRISLGFPVTVITLFQTHPSGSIF